MITNNIFNVLIICIIVGGSYPHYALDVPDSTEELLQLLDRFKHPNSDRKEAEEVKINKKVVRELSKEKVQY